jgi:DNA polymerase-1
MTKPIEYNWILVDGKNLAMRIFATHKDLKTNGSEPHYTGLAHGFVRNLNLLKRRYHGRIVICWDRGRKRRMDLFADYKKSRREKWEHEDLYNEHRKPLREVLKHTGVRQVAKRGCEADDLIYTLALRLDGIKLIASNDHDFFQLLRLDDVHISLSKKKRNLILNRERFEAEYKCTPWEYFDAMCLAGDSGDDIPGLYRVGIKTALKILRGERDKPEGADEIRKRNVPLIRLYDEHPLMFSRNQFNKDALTEVLEIYQLETLLGNMHWLEKLGE